MTRPVDDSTTPGSATTRPAAPELEPGPGSARTPGPTPGLAPAAPPPPGTTYPATTTPTVADDTNTACAAPPPITFARPHTTNPNPNVPANVARNVRRARASNDSTVRYPSRIRTATSPTSSPSAFNRNASACR